MKTCIVEELLSKVTSENEVFFTHFGKKQIVPSSVLRKIFRFFHLKELCKDFLLVSKCFLGATVSRIRNDRFIDKISLDYETTLDFTKNPFVSENEAMKFCFHDSGLAFCPNVLLWNLCFPSCKVEELYPLAITIFARNLKLKYFKDESSVVHHSICVRLRMIAESLKSTKKHHINPWNITDDFIRKLSVTEGVLFNHPLYEITCSRASIFWTCFTGKVELFKELFLQNPDRSDFTANILRKLAIFGGEVEMVKHLDLPEYDFKKVSRMKLSRNVMLSGSLDVLKHYDLLLKKRHDVSAFRYVCSYGDCEIVQFILENSHLSSRDVLKGYWRKGLKDTPRHMKVLELLIAKAEEDAKHSKISTSESAFSLNSWSSRSMFRDLFKSCCRLGSVEIVKRLLELNVDFELRDYEIPGLLGRLVLTKNPKKQKLLKILEEREICKATDLLKFTRCCANGDIFRAEKLIGKVKLVPKPSEFFVSLKPGCLDFESFVRSIGRSGSMVLLKKFTDIHSGIIRSLSGSSKYGSKEEIIVKFAMAGRLDMFKFAVTNKYWKPTEQEAMKLVVSLCKVYCSNERYLKYLVEEYKLDLSCFASSKVFMEDISYLCATNLNIGCLRYLFTEHGLRPKKNALIEFIQSFSYATLSVVDVVVFLIKSIEETLDFDNIAKAGPKNSFTSKNLEKVAIRKKILRIASKIALKDDRSKKILEQATEDSKERWDFVTMSLFGSETGGVAVKLGNFEIRVVKFLWF